MVSKDEAMVRDTRGDGWDMTKKSRFVFLEESRCRGLSLLKSAVLLGIHISDIPEETLICLMKFVGTLLQNR